MCAWAQSLIEWKVRRLIKRHAKEATKVAFSGAVVGSACAALMVRLLKGRNGRRKQGPFGAVARFVQTVAPIAGAAAACALVVLTGGD